MSTQPRWRAPRLWLWAQLAARVLVSGLARVRVSGATPAPVPAGPLILAANHISPFDPIAMAAACRVRGLSPRFLATGGLFRAPVVGAVMRHWGHIPVHRRTPRVAEALSDAQAALAAGSVVLVYPEGRIGLDPRMWPERGRTGAARLALATGAPVVPVAQWGAHEVVPYSAPRGLWRTLPRTILRRPVIRVRFGAPVDLSDLDPAVPGSARRATDRIIAAIAAELAVLRIDEMDAPRHRDPTRPAPQPVPAPPHQPTPVHQPVADE